MVTAAADYWSPDERTANLKNYQDCARVYNDFKYIDNEVVIGGQTVKVKDLYPHPGMEEPVATAAGLRQLAPLWEDYTTMTRTKIVAALNGAAIQEPEKPDRN